MQLALNSPNCYFKYGVKDSLCLLCMSKEKRPLPLVLLHHSNVCLPFIEIEVNHTAHDVCISKPEPNRVVCKANKSTVGIVSGHENQEPKFHLQPVTNSLCEILKCQSYELSLSKARLLLEAVCLFVLRCLKLFHCVSSFQLRETDANLGKSSRILTGMLRR